MRFKAFISSTALAAILVAASAPAASSAVIKQQFGGATAHTRIIGSDQHLPPVAATSPYMTAPSLGPGIVALRQAGGYTADIDETVLQARKYLDRWLTKKCGRNANGARVIKCRAMLVADIDDTLVSWYSYYASPTSNWTVDKAAESAVMKACGTPAIKPTVKLLQYAESRGVAIVLISGRTEAQRSYTASCVKKIGVNGFKELIVRSPAQARSTAERFKSQERRALVRAGWKIALSVGDQVSDMSGGYAEAGFLLPNPMYFIP